MPIHERLEFSVLEIVLRIACHFLINRIDHHDGHVKQEQEIKAIGHLKAMERPGIWNH